MRMLNVEYERVSGMTVPGSQARWEINRGTLEQVFTVRGIQEIVAKHSQFLCTGYLDQSTCFMSFIQQTQWLIEEYLGVDVAVIRIMQALHEEITGR